MWRILPDGIRPIKHLIVVIDDVRLYNAALTPAEVQALPQAGGGG
jgi:hypothetical protein